MKLNTFIFGFILATTAAPVFAQSDVLPPRRAITFENTDLYGGDIRTLRDTTLDICVSACLADGNCEALTFNQEKGACFLKNNGDTPSAFQGAISLRIQNASSFMQANAAAQLSDLEFLPDGYLTRATRRAANIGREYPLNENSFADLNRYISFALDEDDFATAMHNSAILLSLVDDHATWLNVAKYAIFSARASTRNTSRVYSLARDAAVNAYLRATTNPERAEAAYVLSTLLERAGFGRKSIDALRLSQRQSPKASTAEALERAIGLYGFRVRDYQVDNNAVRPRICINFSEELIETGEDYSRFLRIASGDLPVEADGGQLCIDGVVHGQTYEITLRAGLPSLSGEALTKSSALSVYVKDRDAGVHFVGQTYVLPMSATPAIPVVSVNADEIELRLFRIGERNLVSSALYGILGTALDDYSERDLRNERGEEVWSGIGEVSNTLNEDVTTALPLSDVIQSFEPGIYAMTARVKGQSEPWESAATQWFIVTDLGLETLLGADGLHVFTRSLRSGAALSGITATLIASNNEVLFQAQSDENGYARIPEGYTRGTGGNSPALLQVRSAAGDFAFLDLNESAMDLSDRGVAGRAAPEKIDIFASFERGAYRPGETVFATILARDSSASAIPDLPLTAILYRPDGVEHSRNRLFDAGAGGRVFEQSLSTLAMRGTWRLEILADPEGSSLKTMRFLVEDFTPERIDFSLDLEERAFATSESPILDLAANFLYGAPAGGLPIEGEVEISAVRSYAGYEDYYFGLTDEPYAEGYAAISSATTDPEGKARLQLTIPSLDSLTRPLQLRATLRVSDGSGSPVERSITRALLPEKPSIGIRPLFEGALREGNEAAFEIIAINPEAARTDMRGVSWSLSRIERNYQWYKINNRWNWEPITRKTRIASGEIDLSSSAAIRIGSLIGWGRYELKLVRAGNEYTASAFLFNSGWWSADASSDTPDMLEVSLDQPRYTIGDVAQLRLTPRVAGKVVVRVMSDRLISMQVADVQAGEQVISVPVKEEWGAGAYIVATLIQPMNEAQSRNPTRAVGLAYAPTDPGKRALEARFDMPAEIEPRGPLLARLRVSNIPAGETVYATIAAVDLGILNLTGFASPAPSDYYFGQQRLGMEIRDIYGRLIDGMQGIPGRMRSGGDGALARVKAPPPTQKLIAYFSGPLTVGADGTVTAAFDLPAFNGTVRLMAVVWSDSGIGEAEADILVRDPVVLTTNAPAFLGPDDRAEIEIKIANVSGMAGAYSVEISGNDNIGFGQAPLRASLDLAQGAQATLRWPLVAGNTGDAGISLRLQAPDGSSLRYEIPLEIRANDPPIQRSMFLPLAKNGGTFSIDDNVFAEIMAGGGEGSFALGPLGRFDVAGMLAALDRTPWGGTETRVAKAMPLLYLDSIAQAIDIEGNYAPQARIDDAIEAVLANQTSQGAFGNWKPESGDLWLDAFASDFLSRAQAEGFTVPERAFTQALDNLRNQLNYAGDFENAGQGLAYALMVLAREGRASLGDLRYYADVKANDFATPMALAQLGAALAFTGDQIRADKLFAMASQRVNTLTQEDTGYRTDYGSFRRDAAAVLALATEAESTAIDRQVLARYITRPSRNYSTQERLWQLMAARALLREGTPDITIDGAIPTGPALVYFDAQSLEADPILIRNNANRRAQGRLSVSGPPATEQPRLSEGYRISRWLYTLDGEEASLDSLMQNRRYVVILRVTPEQERRGRLVISDPLPAGFVIDNPNLLRSGDIAKMDWVQLDATGANAQFMSDRFMATLTWRKESSFQMAYIVRAVSVGQFRQPAALVEDMYRPSLRATTGANQIMILPAN